MSVFVEPVERPKCPHSIKISDGSKTIEIPCGLPLPHTGKRHMADVQTLDGKVKVDIYWERE